MKRRAWIFDLDGTLVNTDHRIHHIKPPEGKKKDWSAFFAASKQDTPYTHVVSINQNIDKAADNVDVIFVVTARPENLRRDTEKQLNDIGVIWDALYMRPVNERKPDFEVKRDIYRNHIKPSYEVVAAFEDRLQVAKMWREEGVPVLLCGDEWLKSDWSE